MTGQTTEQGQVWAFLLRQWRAVHADADCETCTWQGAEWPDHEEGWSHNWCVEEEPSDDVGWILYNVGKELAERIVADHNEHAQLRAKAALADAWQNRTKLLSGRWPCPDCGRESHDATLRAIEYADGSLHGCWLCTTEDLRARYDALTPAPSQQEER